MMLTQLLNTSTRNELVSKLGLGNGSILEQEESLLILSHNIAAQILLAVSDRLTTEDKERVAALLKSNSIDALFDFLQTKVSNFENVVQIAAATELQAISDKAHQ